MKLTNIQKAKNIFITFLVCTAVAISILSQMFNIFAFRALTYVAWGLLIIVSLLYIEKGIGFGNFLKFSLIPTMIFILYCLLLSIVNKQFLNNPYIIGLVIVFACSYIGTFLKKINLNLKPVIFTYFCFSLIYAIFVNIQYFPSLNEWFSSYSYKFSLKNSASQIWGSSIIIAYYFLFKKTENKFFKISFVICCLYLVLVIFLSQCKTVITALLICSIINFIKYSRHKVFYGLAIFIMCAFLSRIDLVNDAIEHFLQLDKFQTLDLNNISSNRLALWGDALVAITKSPFIGNGDYYVDNLYIMAIASSGIIGSALIFLVWGKRIFNNFVNKNSTPYSNLLITLTIFYIVESIFEGMPPFGPGTCCFMFWVLSSYLENI